MNVPVLSVIGTDSTSPVPASMFHVQVGALESMLESMVPEQVLATTSQPAPAISAETAMAMALAQGQKVYSVTPTNWPTVMPQIQASSTELTDINNALAAGDQVIFHTGQVSIPGWSGVGYIIIDPATGDGAYKISGGADGGAKQLEDSFQLLVAGALGLVDGSIDHLMEEARNSWAYMTLDDLSNNKFASEALGRLALAIAAVTILLNSSLSGSQKLGQVSVKFLGYGLTSLLTDAVLGSALVAALPEFAPVLLVVVLAVAITGLVQWLEDTLFTYETDERRRIAYA
jgi:hypothetical protein